MASSNQQQVEPRYSDTGVNCSPVSPAALQERSLAGRVALVTGAGSGIGKATALRLAREGACVGVLSRTRAQVEQTVAEIGAQQAAPLLADVSQPEQVERAVAELTNRWGRLDIVIANAGINGVWAPVEEITPEEWGETQSINLMGTFLTVKYAVPWLKKQGGAICIVSSVNGTRMFSNAGGSAYATSKAGQVAFAKMIALELAPQRIRVNAVCPGWITTEIRDNTHPRHLDQIRPRVTYAKGVIPLTDGKPGTAEDVAELLHFLVSDAARHITGTEVWIDGAESLLQG